MQPRFAAGVTAWALLAALNAGGAPSLRAAELPGVRPVAAGCQCPNAIRARARAAARMLALVQDRDARARRGIAMLQ